MRAQFGKASILVLCIVMSVCLALAAPKDNGKGKGADKSAQSAGKESEVKDKGKDGESGAKAKGADKDSHEVEIIWRQTDRDHITRYYVTTPGSLPPGLAKRRGELPPGLEKQLRRNGHLPPGLEKKLMPFPVELERRLPPLMPGTARGIIGASAVIFNSKTFLILDVFSIL